MTHHHVHMILPAAAYRDRTRWVCRASRVSHYRCGFCRVSIGGCSWRDAIAFKADHLHGSPAVIAALADFRAFYAAAGVEAAPDRLGDLCQRLTSRTEPVLAYLSRHTHRVPCQIVSLVWRGTTLA